MGSADSNDPAGELEDAITWAISSRVRTLRGDRGFTLEQLGERTGISKAMLSKVENGQTSISLATLARLASGLDVPVTTFFRDLNEDAGEAVFVAAGNGPEIVREGTRAGHRYELLGVAQPPFDTFEPVLVRMTEQSEVFPLFQHAGVEMLYMLEGQLEYSHGRARHVLRPGDTLLFDASIAHGPSRLIEVPIRFLSIKMPGDHTASR